MLVESLTHPHSDSSALRACAKGLSLNRASLMVSLLAVSGALGTVISATLGWKCVEAFALLGWTGCLAQPVSLSLGWVGEWVA